MYIFTPEYEEMSFPVLSKTLIKGSKWHQVQMSPSPSSNYKSLGEDLSDGAHLSHESCCDSQMTAPVRGWLLTSTNHTCLPCRGIPASLSSEGMTAQYCMFFTIFPDTVQEPNAKLQAYNERYPCYSMVHQDSLSQWNHGNWKWSHVYSWRLRVSKS